MLKRGSMVLAVAWTLIGVITVTAQERGGPPRPSPEHKKLGCSWALGKMKPR